MTFESLSDRLRNISKSLRGKGRLSEADMKAALKEIKMAPLETDVSSKVVEQFINPVQERAIGQDVLNSLAPRRVVMKTVRGELIDPMDSEITEIALGPSSKITVIMMTGLRGAGKATATAKIAGKLRIRRRKPLLTTCDVYHPAAIQQLQINSGRQGTTVLPTRDSQKPMNIAKAAIERAGKNGYNVVVLDIADRLHIGENMMGELTEIKEAIVMDQTLPIVDAVTGQDAVNAAEMFNSKIGINGVIPTKLDGDIRGGATFSIRAVIDRPILCTGVGGKLPDLEQSYPNHTASRILGTEDTLSLIERTELEMDEQKAKELNQRLKKTEFGYNDFLDQMRRTKKMGGMSSTMNTMSGMPQMKENPEVGESTMDRVGAIVPSMTAQERANPTILSPPRKQRIARSAGVDISEANHVTKQFGRVRKITKQLPSIVGGKGGNDLGEMLGKFKVPFQTQRRQQNGFSALTINLGFHPQDRGAVLRDKKVKLTWQ